MSAVGYYIVHALYGCESGCCGHQLIYVDEHGNTEKGHFDFDHFYGDESNEVEMRAWADSWGDGTVPLMWDRCRINEGC